MIDRSAFEQYVQEALEHLFDPADLLVHPLGALLLPRGSSEPPGPALHRALREAIALLKPRPDAPIHSPSWRLYRYLSLRYVEMLTIGQVASELGISPRQCRRDHHDALSAVASILWDQYRHLRTPMPTAEPVPNATSSLSDERLLDAELGKMGATAVLPSDLGRIVQSVVGTLGALAARKGVLLQVDLPSVVPPVVVDRTVLRQMLLELLLDAIDRGSGGRVSLAVDVTADQVRLTIAVGGVPSRPIQQPTQTESSESRLDVSRRLAQLQGIGLLVETGPEGLTTNLTLPSGPVPIVLVVDDNADVIHMFRHYLEGFYEVREATSGEQAIDLARQIHPGAITLDVMMPAQDGWEVLQTLKLDPDTSAIPIIVCSVLRERELALSLGAADFLAKPITGPVLVSALQRCRLAS